MKRDSREKYVSALKQHALKKTVGQPCPVVVSAYRFFDEAANGAGLPHTFTSGDIKKILDMFDEDFRQSCVNDDDGFPITVLKMTRNVIELVGHGRQAVIDDDRTPEAYKAAATISGRNAYEGWVLIGPDVPKDHPMIGASLKTQQQRLETSVTNFNDRVEKVAPKMMIGEQSTVEVSEIEARRAGLIA